MEEKTALIKEEQASTSTTPTTFQEPSAPTPNLVVVTNLAPNTSEKTLREFFSFCGEIEELHLIPQGETQKAIVRFKRESAARTALLLSNAYLGEKNIFVSPYFDDLPPYVNQDTKEDEKETRPIRQEDKPKLSIVVEMLANGYVLNDRIIDGAKGFDDKHGITSTFKSYFTSAQSKSMEINEKYQISTKAEVLAQTAKGVATDIDSTYHVSEKIQNVSEDVQKKAAEIDEKYHVKEKIGAATTSVVNLAETAIASETGQKVQSLIFDLWNKAKAINEEAKRKALELEGKQSVDMISTPQELHLNPTFSPLLPEQQIVVEKRE